MVVGLVLAGASPPANATLEAKIPDQISPSLPPAIDYSPYPKYNPDPCYRDKNHDAADLCAQWRAAIAAENAATLSTWSNWIAGVGALLSFLSIVLVIAALRQTERSLRETRAANEIARDTATRQLRAYINFADARIPPGGPIGKLCLTVDIHNGGQTPAYDLRAVYRIQLSNEGPDRFRFMFRDSNPVEFSKSVVGPGRSTSISDDYDLTPALRWALAKNTDTLVIFAGIVTYRDAFGKRRLSTFRYFIDPGALPGEKGALLKVCGTGNSAN
jgi:hypothetical protein